MININCMKKILILIYLHFMTSLTFSQYMPFTPYPYNGIEKEIKTEHFIIIYPKKYEEKALLVAHYAEEIHKDLVPFMNWKPLYRTKIILTNYYANPNGMATTSPDNTIIIFLTPTAMEKTLDTFTDPLYTLILHEYTHILHIDQIRDYAWFWRVAMGRVYFPVFNNSFMWYREGFATLVETLYSENGRLDGYYNRAMVKVAARDGKIPPMNLLVPQVNVWPYNRAIYHYGAAFLEYIYTKYGKEKFDKIYMDISKIFFPIVHIFVWNFKNIYGKSIKDLWKEWIEYEKVEAEKNYNQYVTEYMTEPKDKKQLTEKQGNVETITISKDGVLYYSIDSYKTDRYLYMNKEDKNVKLKLGNISAIESADDKIIYSKSVVAPNMFYYYDLFLFDPITRITKRLTTSERINSISYMNDGKNKTILYSSYLNDKIKLYKANFNKNRIDEKREIEINKNIYFIYNIDSSPNNNGDTILSVKYTDGTYSIICININENITKWEKRSKNKMVAKYLDNENIYFTYRTIEDSILYLYNIKENKTKFVMKRFGGISEASIYKDYLYYASYTSTGEEIFRESFNVNDSVSIDSLFFNDEIVVENGIKKSNEDNNVDGDNAICVNNIVFQKETSSFYNRLSDFDPSKYKPKNFNPFRYLYPTIWYLLPYQIFDSAILLDKSGNQSIPFFSPKFTFLSEQPTGRFGYRGYIALDYLRGYYVNGLSFWFRLPYFNISYGFDNFAIGNVSYIASEDRWNINKNDGMFPISLSNSINISSSIPLFGYGTLSFQSSVGHTFYTYDFNLKKESNYISFSQGIFYQYIVSTSKTSRWDRGIYLENFFYIRPPILDNHNELYILKNSIEGRIPIPNSFLFLRLAHAFEICKGNYFSVYYRSVNLNEILLGTNIGSGISQIPMKAFPGIIDNSKDYENFKPSNFSGSSYVKFDTGFDITVYKKGVYFYFLTMGLKEFFIRPYFEFAYLYNDLNVKWEDHLKNIFIDIALEFNLDMFVSYGNFDFSIIQGFAIGYRPMMTRPAFNIYLGIDIGLNI